LGGGLPARVLPAANEKPDHHVLDASLDAFNENQMMPPALRTN
jgi:hypothetical protein